MSLKEKLGKKFVITTELGPTDGVDVETTLAKAKKYIKIDGINIHDCPNARLRMNSVMLASLIQKELGINTIPHFTCRDRSLLGTQADLLGAHALGIGYLLPTTGDPPNHSPYPSKAVYDLNTLGLMKLIKKMNNGLDYNDKEFKGHTDFMISATASPVVTNMEGAISRVKSKIEAGADFFQTQAVYDAEKTIDFMEKVKPFNVPVILGIMPFKSLKMAEFVKNQVDGIEVPDEVNEKMKEPGKPGVKIVCEVIKDVYKYVDGIHIMAMGDVEATNEIIDYTLSLF